MIFTLSGSSDSLIINVLHCRSQLKFLNFTYCEKIPFSTIHHFFSFVSNFFQNSWIKHGKTRI